RVADLVRDRGRELVDARLLLGLHRCALPPELALHGGIEEAFLQGGPPEDAHPVPEEADPPRQGHPIEPDIAASEQHAEDVDEEAERVDAEVAHQVCIEARLGRRTPARATVRFLFWRQWLLGLP